MEEGAMNIHHILEELAFDAGELPREAIEAAISLKEEITPYLLEILEQTLLQIEDVIEHDNYQGHLYAIYLLAQFREQKALPHILKLLSLPGDTPYTLIGDVITEDLSRILASCAQEEIVPLKQLIENREVNEYVRAAAISALVTLTGCGLRARREIISYFKALFLEKLEKSPSFVWDSLILASCDLYPEELHADIEKAFKEGLIDLKFISLDYVEKVLSSSREDHLLHLYKNAELIDDTVTEMEKWLSNATFN